MPTMDERFHVFEGGWRARLARDVRLLRFLATITHGWIVGGDQESLGAPHLPKTWGCSICIEVCS